MKLIHYATTETIDHVSTGASMRKLREESGLSLRYIARHMGISAPFLSDLELGRRKWTTVRVAQMAKLIGVKLDCTL